MCLRKAQFFPLLTFLQLLKPIKKTFKKLKHVDEYQLLPIRIQ